jgi:anti-sigma B factor antagonist
VVAEVDKVSDHGYTVEMIKGLPVVRAPEELDINGANGLRVALLESAARGYTTFVVDMSDTRFCDSAGLHVLVKAHKLTHAKGGELRLVIPSMTTLRVFAVTGLDSVIPHFPTLDDALDEKLAVTFRLPAEGKPQ